MKEECLSLGSSRMPCADIAVDEVEEVRSEPAAGAEVIADMDEEDATAGGKAEARRDPCSKNPEANLTAGDFGHLAAQDTPHGQEEGGQQQQRTHQHGPLELHAASVCAAGADVCPDAMSTKL